jgi:hypothetical protein
MIFDMARDWSSDVCSSDLSLGPLLATFTLAHFNLLTLYMMISGLTLAVLWAFLASRRK